MAATTYTTFDNTKPVNAIRAISYWGGAYIQTNFENVSPIPVADGMPALDAVLSTRFITGGSTTWERPSMSAGVGVPYGPYTSLGTTNATVAYAFPAILYSATFNNDGAASRYIKLYDSAAAPTVGVSVPTMVFEVLAHDSKNFVFDNGIRFLSGIAFAVTANEAATDATAIGAGEVTLNLNAGN